MLPEKHWIAVDFDGTLVENTWAPGQPFVPGRVGRPIALMVNRVTQWLAQGKDVRILTARIASTNTNAHYNKLIIERWCEKHFGQILVVTSEKDQYMTELWDDRAIQLIPDTGVRVDGRN